MSSDCPIPGELPVFADTSQNKTPLSPTQVFQDVPSDHAFKTMTMEPFPHSGAQLASVHPCKHASVMKKFIGRMDEASGTATPAGGAGAGTGPSTSGSGSKKGKWGIGGMVRRVTGTGKDVSQTQQQQQQQQSAGEGDGEDEGRVKGVQVDFYLVIVSTVAVLCIIAAGNRGARVLQTDADVKFLKFIASIVPTIEVRLQKDFCCRLER